MELPRLIAELSQPIAYPEAADAVEVRQTHISVVFLVGPYAYKIKKPLALGFLDFSTLERRRHFCEQEVRLNRRLAPIVYVGVVPVTRADAGVRMEGQGEVVEWAVKMMRLPDEATLESWLKRGELGVSQLDALARRIAAFHARANAGTTVAAWGCFTAVAANAGENFDESAGQVGTTVSPAVFDRVRQLTELLLADLRPIIEARADCGLPRDGHGDLRLDHIYVFPDRPPPSDVVVIDCIEFAARFRLADPVADMAFLVMDLSRRGRRDLAKAFADEYFRAAGDAEGRLLLPFYTAYRAVVRAKVEGMKLLEPEVPAVERAAALTRARAHWLVALAELEAPGLRPCLVLVGGLPGTGKTTLAEGLADRAGFSLIRTDNVRKELAGVRPDQPMAAGYEMGLYAPEWTERTYAECLRRAEARLFDGERVLVDASFRTDATRRQFLEAAGRLSVPATILFCKAAPEVARARLERRRGDSSDADWPTYLEAAARFEPPSPFTRAHAHEIDADDRPDVALSCALDVLGLLELWHSSRFAGVVDSRPHRGVDLDHRIAHER